MIFTSSLICLINGNAWLFGRSDSLRGRGGNWGCGVVGVKLLAFTSGTDVTGINSVVILG